VILADGPATMNRVRKHEKSDVAWLYQLLINSAIDYAIFALDRQGHIVTWNAGAKRIKGYNADEIIGKHFSIFYPPQDLAVDKPGYELVVAAREGRFEDEGWRVRKDGSMFWANVVITALRDDSGKLVGFGKVTRDLTERRDAEEARLRDTRKLTEAETANRTKTEFLAMMSHELRTPLNAIGGYAELLSLGVAGALNDQQTEYLDRIRLAQQHLLNIVTDLLNYSRIEAGEILVNEEAVRLNDVIEAGTKMVELQARSKQIKLEIKSCPVEWIARIDRAKTDQIILNLLSNAVKFTPVNGTISLACDRNDTEYRLAVKDTGPGIPRVKQEPIFEPFVQLGRTFSTLREGTGLGLSISRELARAMGGDVIVESEPGRGSTFTLVLPIEGRDGSRA
jgi:PAS domain S-box-containing protein